MADILEQLAAEEELPLVVAGVMEDQVVLDM
jgi:hypothetical protein